MLSLVDQPWKEKEENTGIERAYSLPENGGMPAGPVTGGEEDFTRARGDLVGGSRVHAGVGGKPSSTGGGVFIEKIVLELSLICLSGSVFQPKILFGSCALCASD